VSPSRLAQKDAIASWSTASMQRCLYLASAMTRT
jgi:hypothetical protein